MADPLSIAAGVAGILTAAAQISSLLIKFTKSAKDAPQQARVIITEVSDTSGILSHLQSFLVGSELCDRSRTSLLKVDQVVTIVSGCVLTFSELEKLLDEMNIQHMKIPDCFKWARKESTITDLIHRLQNHKASLSLMLNILNGNTIAEAKDSVDRLYTLVNTCYDDMSSRLSALETKQTRLADSASTIRPEEDTASILTGIPGPSSYDVTHAVNSEIKTHDFTEVLQRSWVYTRNKAFQSSIYSLSTTDAHSTRWSCLSGLSMAEVSNLSVLNLVITVNEVCNPSRSSQTWSSNDVLSVSDPQCSTVALPSHKPTEYDETAYPCTGRGEILEEGPAFELASKRWHIDCFRCNTCDTILDSDENLLLLEDGSLICGNCTYARSVCGRDLKDLAILAGDQAFCDKCFRCRKCKGQIDDRKYARTSQGLFCERCHNSLVERRKRKEMAEGISKFYEDWAKQVQGAIQHGNITLPQIKVAELPTAVYTSSHAQLSNTSLENDTVHDSNPGALAKRSQSCFERCVICAVAFTPNVTRVRSLPCHHIYHLFCIDLHLTSLSSRCPICLVEVAPGGSAPIIDHLVAPNSVLGVCGQTSTQAFPKGIPKLEDELGLEHRQETKQLSEFLPSLPVGVAYDEPWPLSNSITPAQIYSALERASRDLKRGRQSVRQDNITFERENISLILQQYFPDGGIS